VLEIAAADRRQGTIFYTLPQKPRGESDPPLTLSRQTECLACHLSWDTRGVPGLMTTSMYPLPDDPNAYANGFTTVQGSPLDQRWGGWWVTGDHGGARHMGNIPVMPVDKKLTRPNPRGVLASVEGLDRSLEDAARSLGASPAQVAFYVMAPALVPAMMAGSALTFATSMGAFGTAFTIAQQFEVLPMLVYTELTLAFNIGMASALACVLGVITFGMLSLYRMLGGSE
jgi:hypothetical protein